MLRTVVAEERERFAEGSLKEQFAGCQKLGDALGRGRVSRKGVLRQKNVDTVEKKNTCSKEFSVAAERTAY